MEFILIKENLISSRNFGFYVFFFSLSAINESGVDLCRVPNYFSDLHSLRKIQLHFFEEYFKLIPMSRIFTEHVAIK